MGVLDFIQLNYLKIGVAPFIWALVLGLKKSSSTFFMNEGADSGDILSQKDFDISMMMMQKRYMIKSLK